MRLKPIHPKLLLPTKSTSESAAFDLYMPESGSIPAGGTATVGLGFAAAIPKGYVGLILPRSGIGTSIGLELNNTCGVIDSDYRGEWHVVFRTKRDMGFAWNEGDRLFQVVIVPVANVEIDVVPELDDTERGTGGFGSTGK